MNANPSSLSRDVLLDDLRALQRSARREARVLLSPTFGGLGLLVLIVELATTPKVAPTVFGGVMVLMGLLFALGLVPALKPDERWSTATPRQDRSPQGGRVGGGAGGDV